MDHMPTCHDMSTFCVAGAGGSNLKKRFQLKAKEDSKGKSNEKSDPTNPIASMYGVFTYIWLIFMENVGKYTMHGWYGNACFTCCRIGKTFSSERS